jgi:hypothetical protein
LEFPALARNMYGMTKQEALLNGICVRCKLPPTFYSMAGRAEYPITGLCEPCFDLVTEAFDLVTEAEEEPMEIKQSIPMTDAEYDFETIASSQAYKDAERLGLEVVLPQDNQLQIDIDDEASYQVYLGNLKRYKLHFADNPVIGEEIHPSKSNVFEKKHITVTLAEPIISKGGWHRDNEKRILLQVLLGSDPVREMLSYIRLINDDEHPTLFMEKPAQKLLETPPDHLMLGPGDYVKPNNEDTWIKKQATEEDGAYL